MWVEKDSKKNIYWPSSEMKKKAHVSDEKIYDESLKDPVKFWSNHAKKSLNWFKSWEKDYEEDFPDFKWFSGGKINASFNCLDRHVENNGNKPAIIWEPEPVEEKEQILTYNDLLQETKKFANVLKKLGVKKGDTVGIYLPMTPHVQIAMLACARIGAIHSVVFSAFSSEALKTRLIDAESKILITANGYWRRGKKINLKKSADAALPDTKVQKVVVVKRLEEDLGMKSGRDFYWDELMEKVSDDCSCEEMESNEKLFLLYTSGTTGKPKGVVHDTGGYLIQSFLTTKWNFDLHSDDVFWCTADIGWITGHTYSCYGPLSNGLTMVIYEGSPDFPEPDRFWKIIEKFKVSAFYTAPTAIRMFARLGKQFLEKHDLSSLKILGTVGEPIDLDSWNWFFEVVGKKRCPIIDTWWQTETGANVINALPGIGPFIPTVAGRPFPGIVADIFDDSGKTVKNEKTGDLVLKSPFPPGLLRGVYKNPEKFKDTYWSDYPDVYYSSDGAKFVFNKNIRVTGRIDDVMKVAGHLLSTAEMENAINSCAGVSECAVIPKPDKIKGFVPVAFVILKKNFKKSEEFADTIVQSVRKTIGPIAKPYKIIFVDELPKTRSGKIVRRMIRNIVSGEPIGDSSTLENPNSVNFLKKVIERELK